MTYEEAYLYMKEAGKRGSVYGTETVKELLLRLGNPQDRVPVVHIAGTNHVSVPNISSESSELFIRNIRTFRQKHPSFSSKPPGFSKQMPTIPLAEVED